MQHSTDISEKDSGAAAPDLTAALMPHTLAALERLAAQARREVSGEISKFVSDDYKKEPGLAKAVRDAENNGVNVAAEMAHFSSSVAAHVLLKLSSLGGAFFRLSAADIDKMADEMAQDLNRDDAAERSMIAANNRVPAADPDGGADSVSGYFKRAAAEKKAKQQAQDQDIGPVEPLRKETIRALLKDHEWKAAVMGFFEMLKHPLLYHREFHPASPSSSLPPRKPAAPAPKGP